MSDRARLAAYNAVKRIFGGAYSNLISFGDDLTGLDRAFAESIALGTLERKITLESVISELLQKETGADVVYLLMTGVYQILYMDRVPDNAACDETVGIAKELFGKSTAGFVNAVMRTVCRNKNEIEKKIENSKGYIKFSVNEALFELIKSQYPNDYERIFSAFFGKSPTFLRINTLKADAETVAIKTDGRVLSKKTVVCNDAQKAISLLGNGEFYIQGAASQKAVEFLGAAPGDIVIDVCACPGGKSLGAAIDMNNIGSIFSFDLHEKKLPLIEKSAKKLGVSIISTSKHDARMPKDELIEKADKVICDVPCSGTGVMGTKPEIKHKSPDGFKGLYPTQRAIIRAASEYLKIGGTMVYSTCSINKKENEDIVHDFLEQNKRFRLVGEKTYLPFEEENEGFYMAKIIREK